MHHYRIILHITASQTGQVWSRPNIVPRHPSFSPGDILVLPPHQVLHGSADLRTTLVREALLQQRAEELAELLRVLLVHRVQPQRQDERRRVHRPGERERRGQSESGGGDGGQTVFCRRSRCEF